MHQLPPYSITQIFKNSHGMVLFSEVVLPSSRMMAALSNHRFSRIDESAMFSVPRMKQEDEGLNLRDHKLVFD